MNVLYKKQCLIQFHLSSNNFLLNMIRSSGYDRRRGYEPELIELFSSIYASNARNSLT